MFTARVQYALVFLVELCENGGISPVTLKEVATKHGLKLEFLEQVSRKLRLAGYVRSIKGPGGGYVLETNLEEVTFFDIFKIMQPESNLKLSVEGEEAKGFIEDLHNEYINIVKELYII